MSEQTFPVHGSLADYLQGRWKDQCTYFESKARVNQARFMASRVVTLITGWLTPLAIFGLTLIPPETYPTLAKFYNVLPLVLSTLAIGSYQWEELHNYGAQWAKFRLVAERLKGHYELFIQRAGLYRGLDDEAAARQFVEYCEGLIEGNDVNYFVLMVDPLRRNAT
jgi:Protein of unknown function (DUF4231)